MESSRTASWQISVATNGVIFAHFVGPTPMDEMLAFIDALVAIMPQANARVVFDLRDLGGYNSETKAPMKAWLLKHKLAIQELTVMVVAAIALATGVKIRIREDLDEMPTFVTP
jgi:hypothetical protein